MKRIILLISIFLINATAANADLLRKYDFEDWGGSVATTPNYWSGSGFVETCTTHEDATEVITGYDGTLPYAGSYFFMSSTSFYQFSPTIPGITAPTVNPQTQVGLGSGSNCANYDSLWEMPTSPSFLYVEAMVILRGWEHTVDGPGYKLLAFYTTPPDGYPIFYITHEYPQDPRISVNTSGKYVSGPDVPDMFSAGWRKIAMSVDYTTMETKVYYNVDTPTANNYTLSNVKTIASIADAGGGNVDITINETTGVMAAGDVVNIFGTSNYDGTYTATGASGLYQVTIPATFSGSETGSLTFSDNYPPVVFKFAENWSNANPTGNTWAAFDDVKIYDALPGATTPPTNVCQGADSVDDPNYTLTGTATAVAGQIITGVTIPGETVTPDDGAWDEQEEAWSSNVVLAEGVNNYTATATDSQDDTDPCSMAITYTIPTATANVCQGPDSVDETAYTLTGVATAAAGQVIVSVTIPDETVTPDDGAWDEQIEAWSSSVTLVEGVNNYTATATDDIAGTDPCSVPITYAPAIPPPTGGQIVFSGGIIYGALFNTVITPTPPVEGDYWLYEKVEDGLGAFNNVPIVTTLEDGRLNYVEVVYGVDEPVIGTGDKGILDYDAYTQFVLWSEDISNIAWLGYDVATSPTTWQPVSQYKTLSQTKTTVIGEKYTFSFMAKVSVASDSSYRLRHSPSEEGTYSDITFTDILTPYSITITPTTTSTVFGLVAWAASDWPLLTLTCLQVTETPVIMPHVATTTATVTIVQNNSDLTEGNKIPITGDLSSILTSEGSNVRTWTPAFSSTDVTTPGNIFTVNDTTPGMISHTSTGISLFDGTNTASLVYAYTTGTPLRIESNWGTHPVDGANKLWLILRADDDGDEGKGTILASSTIETYAGTFTPGSEGSQAWNAELPQYFKNSTWYQEVQP